MLHNINFYLDLQSLAHITGVLPNFFDKTKLVVKIVTYIPIFISGHKEQVLEPNDTIILIRHSKIKCQSLDFHWLWLIKIDNRIEVRAPALCAPI